jgi:hypothetical protein
MRWEHFELTITTRQALGLIQFSTQWVPEDVPWGKTAGAEANTLSYIQY